MNFLDTGRATQARTFPSWIRGKKKKQRWIKSFKYSQEKVKGEKYKLCPTCRGVGGNRACLICFGGGMARIQRQKSNGANGHSYRSRGTNRSFQRNVVSDDLVYERLPFVADDDGECRECGKFPNKNRTMKMSNGEERAVVQCSRCNRIMRWRPESW